MSYSSSIERSFALRAGSVYRQALNGSLQASNLEG